MNVIDITHLILLPFLLWRARRRSKRDNTFTAEEIENFHNRIHRKL